MDTTEYIDTDQIYILQCTEEVIKTGFDKENIQSRPQIEESCCSTESEDARCSKGVSVVKSLNSKMEQKCIDSNSNNSDICSYNRKIKFVGTKKKTVFSSPCSVQYLWENMFGFVEKAVNVSLTKRISLSQGLTANFFIVTHHNRMKKHLFDFIEKKQGLANCSCILLDIKKKTLSLKMIFEGFPDKTEDYSYFKIEDSPDLNTKFLKMIDDKKIIIKEELLNFSSKNTVQIFFIRHGNALHNKPLELKFSNYKRNVDTNLTPLGILQSRLLGEYLIDKGYLRKEQTLLVNYFCASYLNRSQHTLLGIVKSLKDCIPGDSLYLNCYPNMIGLEKMFTNLAIKRLLRKTKGDKKIKEVIHFIDKEEKRKKPYIEIEEYGSEYTNKLLNALESIFSEVDERHCIPIIQSRLGGKKRRIHYKRKKTKHKRKKKRGSVKKRKSIKKMKKIT
jgi:hypothetical protein